MPKLRGRGTWVALTASLAAALALAGCGGGGKGTTSSGGVDASLSAVAFSAGTLSPSFAPATSDYFLTLPFGTATLTLTPTATDARARSITVTQDGGTPATVASGASANLLVPAVGTQSVVLVEVTGRDGTTTLTYGFLVTQTVSHDASLSGLTISAGTLNFVSTTLAYSVSVPNGTSTVTVTPTASGEGATITITQDSSTPVAVPSGSGATFTVPAVGTTSTLSILVTAQDSTTHETYTIVLSQIAGTDSSLASLIESSGALTGFSPTTLTYAYSVPFQTAYTVTPTATSSAVASITVNGTVVADGTAAAVALTTGANTISIVVTAQDGVTQTTYTLSVTEGPPAGLVNARTVPTGVSSLLAVGATALLPNDNDSGVPVDTLLRVGFDSAPTLGTSGTVNIYQVGSSTPVDTINIADPYAIYDGTSTIKKLTTNLTTTKLNVIGGLTETGVDQVRIVNYVPIVISGNTAVIVPHNNKLAYGGQYYVTIDNGLLQGTRNGATFTGMPAPANPGTPDPNAWQFTVKAASPTTYNVASDNSADFATIQGAIDQVQVSGTATISIAPGVYQELLFIRKKTITLQGTDSVNTVVQYDNCDGFNPGTGGGQSVTGGVLPSGNLSGGGRSVVLASSAALTLDTVTLKNLHGQGSAVIPTLPTATTVSGSSSATYINYASAITQAETLYFNVSYGAGTSSAPPSEPAQQLIAEHSNFVSFQDTLQVKGWSWFYDCFVTGDVDFIWGNASGALFERSEIRSRYNSSNTASVVQSRAYLNYEAGSSTTPSTITTAYPGFVFLDCALTKEPGTFTAYLARSPGAPSSSVSGPYMLYTGYDIVAYINCSMDSHIPAIGWNTTGTNPGGANLVSTPVVGWREYGSFTPEGQWIDLSGRLSNPSPSSASLGGGYALTDANMSTFFPSRATIFSGATDGTYTTTGDTSSGWDPQP